ncbi:transforming growth factor beta activator LRRC33 [Callorhinchus milii]|uniref:Negative regulator of reactive oxygen species n=1 Tax=Callorhinchus milii TaxID=7868 RepID=A0A4W3J3Z0_CALMI|nr:transforming growth factor beta activator LRRC33 [Callorhinchus milii]XP_007885208.1 transforming growth factor beta activator LRRC33 [Callorhinchus milii]XP_007885218.1 transforming growth factor beta activator LRRC33 [Callorhinchus milii]|eukprot:gi/632934504/ref/XP_007885202.1/ PREDICTED: negative regulator of reactive oxygen species [Callorhinchus milii]
MDVMLPCLSLTLTMLAMFAVKSKVEASTLRHQRICNLISTTALCQGKKLHWVPVDLPTKTEELYLSENFVQSITNESLLSYSRLSKLNLRNNRMELIESGAFSNNRNLQELNLENNQMYKHYTVTHLALKTIPNLKKLDLSRNSLSEDMASFLVHNLSSLEYLSLTGNAIMRLEPSSFEGLVQLQELNLEKNYIYEIESGTFEALKYLKKLNLAQNHIPCIVDFSLSQIVVLNISHNIMEMFLARETDDEFQLKMLDLSSNKLLFFPLLPKHNKLKSLLLADNEMSFYRDLMNNSGSNKVEFIQIVGNVSNITSVDLWDEAISINSSALDVLDMSRNSFRYLPYGFFEGMTSLSTLNLNQNCLKKFALTEADPLNFLQTIDLSQNQLTHIDFGENGMEKLNLLNLSSNRLELVPSHLFAQMPQITTVDLSRNNIFICTDPVEKETRFLNRSCVVLAYIKSLRYLYLSNCGLTSLPAHVFNGSPITHLDLSYNTAIQFHTETFQDVARSLQFLSLRNTSLTSCQLNSVLSYFSNLQNLDLSENAIVSLPPILKNLALKMLDLRKNQLTTLPHDVLQRLLNSLQIVFLSGNSFDCCKLNWWSSLINAKSLIIADGSAITCNISSKLESVDRIYPITKIKCKVNNVALRYFLMLLVIGLCVLTICVMGFLYLHSKSLPKYVKAKCITSTQY